MVSTDLSKVALVGVELQIVEMDDIGRDCVEQITVVRDHHKSLLPPLKILLQP